MILFYGDPHGVFKPLFSTVEALAPTAVIILGDFDLQAPLQTVMAPILDKTEVYFIHGNHDTDNDDDYDYLFGSELADRNISGKVIEVDGLKIAGLGGVFREKIWHPLAHNGEPVWASRDIYMHYKPKVLRQEVKARYNGLPRQDHSSIWREDVDILSKQQADILVTHEAPSTHRYGTTILDDLAKTMCVKRVFHGHHHDYTRVIEGTKIIVEGIGRAKLKDESGNKALYFA